MAAVLFVACRFLYLKCRIAFFCKKLNRRNLASLVHYKRSLIEETRHPCSGHVTLGADTEISEPLSSLDVVSGLVPGQAPSASSGARNPHGPPYRTMLRARNKKR